MPGAPTKRTLRLHVIVPPAVRRGAALPITLRLENAGRRARAVHLLGREIVFDLVVAREDGTVVWRRQGGSVYPAILQRRVLPPGDTLQLSTEWDQRGSNGVPVPAGVYVIHGELPTDAARPLRTSSQRVRITAV